MRSLSDLCAVARQLVDTPIVVYLWRDLSKTVCVVDTTTDPTQVDSCSRKQDTQLPVPAAIKSYQAHLSRIELINSQAIITFNTVLFAIIYQFFFICLKPYCPTAQFSTIHFTLNTTSPIESFVRIWPTSCCTSTHHFAKDQVARSRWLDLLIGSLVGTFLPHLIINVRALWAVASAQSLSVLFVT